MLSAGRRWMTVAGMCVVQVSARVLKATNCTAATVTQLQVFGMWREMCARAHMRESARTRTYAVQGFTPVLAAGELSSSNALKALAGLAPSAFRVVLLPGREGHSRAAGDTIARDIKMSHTCLRACTRPHSKAKQDNSPTSSPCHGQKSQSSTNLGNPNCPPGRQRRRWPQEDKGNGMVAPARCSGRATQRPDDGRGCAWGKQHDDCKHACSMAKPATATGWGCWTESSVARGGMVLLRVVGRGRSGKKERA